jgi:hypothetical protein
MLNTFIKNRGSTKTIIHDSSNSCNNSHNNINDVNELKWDADYDGDIANISITSDTNGEKKHFNITLDNNDLEHILNIPSVDMPIHKRLKMDYSKPLEPTIYKIELPREQTPFIEEEQLVTIPFDNPKVNTLERLLEPSKRYLSTPLPNEELILPMSINKKDIRHIFTPRRNKKTHKTYRVYKKHKTTTPKKSSRRSNRRTTRRNSIASIF